MAGRVAAKSPTTGGLDHLAAREAELLRRDAMLEARAGKVLLEADRVCAEAGARINGAAGASGENNSPQNAVAPATSPSASVPTPEKLVSPLQASREESIDGTMEYGSGEPAETSLDQAISPRQVPETPTGALGTEATVRYQKARISVLKEELARMQDLARNAQAGQEATETKLSTANTKIRRLEKKVLQLTASNDKAQRQLKEHTVRSESADREISKLRREVQDARRDFKVTASKGSSRDVRLNRATEQIDSLKLQLKDAKASIKDSALTSRKQNEKLISELKLMERQRNELLTAFRKQMKLIDVLKRQKVHIEAATLLSFTEDQMNKALDLTSNSETA